MYTSYCKLRKKAFCDIMPDEKTKPLCKAVQTIIIYNI